MPPKHDTHSHYENIRKTTPTMEKLEAISVVEYCVAK